VAQKLCVECKRIQQVSDWDQFYKRIGLETPSPQQMTEILRNAIRNSEVKGYHINRMEYEHLFNLRRTRDPNLQTLRHLTVPDINRSNPIALEQQISHEIKNLVALEEQLRNNKPRTSRPTKLVLTNLSFRMDEKDIEVAFRQFGKIVAVDLHKDAETQKSKGFAIISCESESMATAVLESMDQSEIDGRKVNIKRPMPKQSAAQRSHLIAPNHPPSNQSARDDNGQKQNKSSSTKKPEESTFVTTRNSAPPRKATQKKKRHFVHLKSVWFVV